MTELEEAESAYIHAYAVWQAGEWATQKTLKLLMWDWQLLCETANRLEQVRRRIV